MPVSVRLLHDYTIVVRPGLTEEEIRDIEADCDGELITPLERKKRLHCVGMRGDLYEVPSEKDAVQLALAGNAVPANEGDLARLLTLDQIKTLQRRELRQRALQTGTATGEDQYDMRSPRTLDEARKKRCNGIPRLSDLAQPDKSKPADGKTKSA